MTGFEERERIKHVFELPDKPAYGNYAKLVLVEITSGEEMDCIKRAKLDQTGSLQNMLKCSLVEIHTRDGAVNKLSRRDMSVDKALDALPSKVRALLLDAFQAVHSPEDEDRDVFRSSRKVLSG